MLRDFPFAQRVSPADGRDPVRIRHAATVMLVRPAESDGAGIEVFTFRRRPSLAFAAGMLVFPGGAVEPTDADETLPWSGPAAAELAAQLSADQALARAVIAGAVRETFEECGVLLAGRPDGSLLAEPLDTPVWEARRRALVAGELTLAGLLRDAGLVLRADLLCPWAHWLTPAWEPRRFDTRFFVAALPQGQDARDLGGEGERAAWVRPAAVLAGHRAGEVPLMPPTIVAMEELACAASVDALLTTRRRPRPVSPWPVQVGADDDGNARFVLRIDLDGYGGGEPGPGSTAVAPEVNT